MNELRSWSIDTATPVRVSASREAVGKAVWRSGTDELNSIITANGELVVEVSANGPGSCHAIDGLGLATLQGLPAEMAGSVTVNRPGAGGGTDIVWTAPLP